VHFSAAKPTQFKNENMAFTTNHIPRRAAVPSGMTPAAVFRDTRSICSIEIEA
jgi:hypothetical protein